MSDAAARNPFFSIFLAAQWSLFCGTNAIIRLFFFAWMASASKSGLQKTTKKLRLHPYSTFCDLKKRFFLQFLLLANKARGALLHGVWKSQKKSHSIWRAKRATLTFWVDKSLLKMPKMVNFASFWKPETCSQTVLPERSILKGQNLMENGQNWNTLMRHFVEKIDWLTVKNCQVRHFWVIFKHCASISLLFAVLLPVRGSLCIDSLLLGY